MRSERFTSQPNPNQEPKTEFVIGQEVAVRANDGQEYTATVVAFGKGTITVSLPILKLTYRKTIQITFDTETKKSVTKPNEEAGASYSFLG